MDDYSNEIMQAQLQEFANSLRTATSTEMSIVLINGTISDELGQASACAMLFDERIYRSAGKANVDAAYALLKTAAAILERTSGGTIKIRMHSPAGEFPVDSGDIRKFITRGSE